MTIPTVPQITATFPDPPNRATDTNEQFRTKSDAWVGNMSPYTVQLNASSAGINAAATAIDAVGVAASTSASNAAASEAAALGYKNAAQTSAGNAATSESNAAGSAATAQAAAGAAAGFTATSTTSLTVGLGSKSLTLAQTGKTFVVGDFVVIPSTANPANFMTGQITAFNAGTGAMTVNATGIGGSGTIASWNVALAGQPAAPVTSGTLTGVLNLAATQSIASAATTDIASANSNTVTITGTTTITALGTAPDGATRNILFSGALTLTHSATSLILPGAANITTTAGDTAEAQSLGSGNWRITRYTRANGLPTVGALRRMVKTAGFTAGVADNGALFELSSASAQTMAFTAAATLGPSWSCWFVNTSTGIWTADPNASEQIDGVTSYSILPGEARLVTCDGSGFSTIIVKPFYLTMTASGTFPVLAPGYTALEGMIWGSGAPGYSGGSNTPGSGSAGTPFKLPRSKLTAAQTVTIGASVAGSAGAGPTSGNDSTFGTLVRGYAPTGASPLSFARGPFPNSGSFSSIQSTDAYSGGYNAPGGSSFVDGIFGGAAGGGVSAYAGAGGAYTPGANGGAGQAPGGGGGAADTGFTGGASGRGELRCWGIPG